ncbi:MAG TPA: PQQ-binding-like beta-propeller repeat protein [Nannocystis sp.]
MAVISLECPNCGAKLSPDDSEKNTRCEYCGTQFELPRPNANQVTVTITKTTTSSSSSSGPLKALMIVMAGVLLLTVGVTMFVAVKSGKRRFGFDTVVSVMTGPGFMWDDYGGAPQVVVLDGKEHVIGRIRVPGEDTLHVAVFAAATGEERYRVGPFGTYPEGYQATYFAAVDDRLLVTDFRGKLRVFALSSGEPITEIALTDRAEQLCLVQEAGETPQLYLTQADKREFLVDVAAPALKDGKRPKACEGLHMFSRKDGDPRATDPERVGEAPEVDGVEVSAVHLDGDDAVARGVKSPGTAHPMAFGFDPKTREIRWKQAVAAVDPASVRERDNAQDGLAAGRYFATYGEGSKGWHLTAFDARSGARLWDQKLRSLFAVDQLHDLVATAEHVYLVRMSSVEVYDAATGQLKATIGKETYDG